MTEAQWSQAILAEPTRTSDGHTRLRLIVAEALYERADEWQEEGRPDKAGRIRWAASQLRKGDYITKRVMKKISDDVDVVKDRLVDGEVL